jgi:hypothetical protein
VIRLGLNDETGEGLDRGFFWERQFQEESTKKQRIFDWIFGVIMPVICFAFDPGIFRGWLIDGAVFGRYKPFAYLLSFSLVMGLSAFLIWGEKLRWIKSFLAGLFFAGGLISFGIALILAPFSLIGILFLFLGLLGFTPFFSAFVYIRNFSRISKMAEPGFSMHSRIAAFALGSILAVTLPALVNLKINAAIQGMKNGDVAAIRRNAGYLKFVAPLGHYEELLRATKDSDYDKEKQRALLEAYKMLSGDNAERNVNRNFD